MNHVGHAVLLDELDDVGMQAAELVELSHLAVIEAEGGGRLFKRPAVLL